MVDGLISTIHKKVDVLIFNPPYVPTPDEELGTTDIVASWAGGSDGRVIIDRFIPLVQVGHVQNKIFYVRPQMKYI